MSNLNLPSLSFPSLVLMGLKDGERRKLAYATTVENGTNDGDKGFAIRHHGTVIAFVSWQYVMLAAYPSQTTTARLHKVLRDNTHSSPWGIGIKQGRAEVRNYEDKSLNQYFNLITVDRGTGQLTID
jgi:hypothetical protein